MADDTGLGLEEDTLMVSALQRSKSTREKSSGTRSKESRSLLRKRPASTGSKKLHNTRTASLDHTTRSLRNEKESGVEMSTEDRDSGVSVGEDSAGVEAVYHTSTELQESGSSPETVSLDSAQESANSQAWNVPRKSEPVDASEDKDKYNQFGQTVEDVSGTDEGSQDQAEDGDWSVGTVAWGVTNLVLGTVYSLLGSLLTLGWGLITTARDYFMDGTGEDKVVPVATHLGAQEQAADDTEDVGDAPRDRVFHICDELRTTEEIYVERLGILVNAKEKVGKLLGADLAGQMFRDVEVIHQFHRDNLLPQLQQRMDNWSTHRRVGDVMRRLAPFLKLYTAYVKDYEKAAALVDTHEARNSAFASLLKDVTANHEGRGSRHRSLKVQSHMMEPVQRVPRYVLLLRDYLKRLPADAPDREDTEKALESVSEAARHFENMMKRDSNMCKLLEIQKSLDGHVNITRGQRELVKEGKLHMVKPSKISEKYVFLFTDMLLVTNKQLLAVVGKYKVKDTLDLREAQAVDGSSLDVPNCFCVRTRDVTIEFCCQDAEEKDQWYEKLSKLMEILHHEGDTSRQDSGIDLDKSTCTVGPGEAVLRGTLQLSGDEGRSWKKRLLTLYDSGRLEACKASQEQESLRVPAMLCLLEFCAELVDAPGNKKCKAVRMRGLGKEYFLADENIKVLERWLQVLQKFTQSPRIHVEDAAS